MRATWGLDRGGCPRSRSVLLRRGCAIKRPSRWLTRPAACSTTAALPIQLAAARRIFLGESVALRSQTGSGKTLAYLLPLLARLHRGTPRQALLFVPTRELALQSVEYAQALRPSSVAMLCGTKPASLRSALLQERAPFVIGTAGQLAAMRSLLDPEDALLRELRRTLRVVILDEADAILHPRGNFGMLNRGRRNKALSALPEVVALRRLLKRRADAAHRRVQLIVASATLSRRALRDLSAVFGQLAGRVGLVTPAVTIAANVEGGGSGDGWDSRVAAVEVAEAMGATDSLLRPLAQQHSRGGEGRHLLNRAVRDGVAVAAGAAADIAHNIIICSERRKSDVIRGLLDQAGALPALLVVRDGLQIADVIEELELVGVRGAVELCAVGTVASRLDAAVASAPPPSFLNSGGRAAPPGSLGAHAPIPAWAASQARGPERMARAWEPLLRAAYSPEESKSATSHLLAAESSVHWHVVVAHESTVRGLDLPQLRTVILSMIPSSAESYTHIAGRTGRMGAQGHAIAVFTRRELDQAGFITRALRGVRWNVRRDREPRVRQRR